MACSGGKTSPDNATGLPNTTLCNTTAANAVFFQPKWMPLLLNILHGLVLLVSLYVLLVLLWYEKKKRVSRSTVGLARMLTMTRNGSVPIQRSRSRRRGKCLRFFCIFGALLCICSCVNDLIYYNVHIHSGIICSFLRNLGVSILAALDATVYGFLWFRQYVVYKRMQLKSRGGGLFINILQWTVLISIVALYAVTNALLICCRRYTYNSTGDYCSQVRNPVNDSFANLWTAGSISLHVILVSLFAFPLLKHSRLKSPKDGQRSPNSGSVFAATKISMVALVKRCLAISVACVGTDVLVMLVTEYALSGGTNSQLRHLLYNINVVLNVMLSTASLKDWKKMLFPFIPTRPSTVGNAAEAGADSNRRNTAFTTVNTNNNNRLPSVRGWS